MQLSMLRSREISTYGAQTGPIWVTVGNTRVPDTAWSIIVISKDILLFALFVGIRILWSIRHLCCY